MFSTFYPVTEGIRKGDLFFGLESIIEEKQRVVKVDFFPWYNEKVEYFSSSDFPGLF